MLRGNTLSVVWLSWLATFVISTQESLPRVTMIYPPKVRDKHPKIYFDAGETVLFNWTSTFPRISLELYQGPRPDGHWAMVSLLSMYIHVRGRFIMVELLTITRKANVSNATHESWNWTARVLPGMKRGHSFHLHLFNADDPTCGRWHSNSSLFEIAQSGSSAAGDQYATPKSHMLPLGLGLGLGLPLLVLVATFATWICIRRRRGKKENGDGRSGQPVTNYVGMLPEQKDGKTELQGQAIGELSDLEIVIEAPSDMIRAELEGSPGRSPG